MHLKIRREPAFLLLCLSDGKTSLKGLGYLCVIYLGSIGLAVVFSPLIYQGVQIWYREFPNAFNDYLRGKDFVDYFERMRWVTILVLLPWLLKKCSVGSLTGLGLRWEWGIFLRYGMLGTALLIFLGILQGFFGKITFLSIHWMTVINCVLAGCILGLIEEVLFRGIVFRLFYSAFRSPLIGIVLSALLFAYVHFKIPLEMHVGEVFWNSAVLMGLRTVLGGYPSIDLVSFANLFVLGLFLNLLFLQKRNLLPCIGFHAGLVFGMLAYKRFFHITVVTWQEWLGIGKVTDAWLMFVIVLCGMSFLWFQLSKKHDEKVTMGEEV